MRGKTGFVSGIAVAAWLLGAVPLAAAEPVRVLATVGMIADVAARVGGECFRVETLVGPGSDPHLFTPAPSDLGRLHEAEIVLYGGLNLEGKLGKIFSRLAQSRPVVAVSEAAVPEEQRLTAAGQPDPHVWMAPGLWQGIVPVIEASFREARPDCAEGLAARAAETGALIAALDAWARASLETLPAERRHLVTAHDAFTYFGRAYGIEVSAIQGISTQSEAAIADIEAVAELITRLDIPAVFVESTINPRTIDALREAVAARGGAVEIGGELFSDAMGGPGTPEGTYPGMIHHNVRAIVTALGGTPAPLPPELAAALEIVEVK